MYFRILIKQFDMDLRSPQESVNDKVCRRFLNGVNEINSELNEEQHTDSLGMAEATDEKHETTRVIEIYPQVSPSSSYDEKAECIYTHSNDIKGVEIISSAFGDKLLAVKQHQSDAFKTDSFYRDSNETDREEFNIISRAFENNCGMFSVAQDGNDNSESDRNHDGTITLSNRNLKDEKLVDFLKKETENEILNANVSCSLSPKHEKSNSSSICNHNRTKDDILDSVKIEKCESQSPPRSTKLKTETKGEQSIGSESLNVETDCAKVENTNKATNANSDYKCTVCGKSFTKLQRLHRHLKIHTRIGPCSTERFPCSKCDKDFSTKGNLKRHNESHMGLKFQCEICDRVFSDSYCMKKHQKVHSNKTFKCDLCEKHLSSLEYLREHQKTHLGMLREKKFSCEKCNKSFLTAHYLERHKYVHVEEKEYFCDICGSSFATERLLNVHKKRLHQRKKTLKCDECDAVFAWPAHLKHHKLKHSEERKHECLICKKRFKSKQNLQSHEKIHAGEKNHKCEICGKAFIEKARLMLHKTVHTGKKEFSCDKCKKSVASLQTLRRHLKLHEDFRPFTCEICNKGFIRKVDLNKHVNIHSGLKAFTCPVCDKSFGQKSTLNLHVKIHSGIKDHECKQCGKSFYNKGDLTSHQKIHGKKLFSCDLEGCEKSFHTGRQLREHRHTHTGVKPYKCEYCNLAFACFSNMRTHRKNKHSDLLLKQEPKK